MSSEELVTNWYHKEFTLKEGLCSPNKVVSYAIGEKDIFLSYQIILVSREQKNYLNLFFFFFDVVQSQVDVKKNRVHL